MTYQGLQLFSSSILRQHAVVAFDHIEIIIPRVGDKFARCVREWHRVLLQFHTQFRHLENATTQTLIRVKSLIDSRHHIPKNTPSDTDQPLWTELRRETPCVIEVVVDERCEVHEVLISIVQPRSRRKRQDGRIPLDLHSYEFDGACSQESDFRENIRTFAQLNGEKRR